MLHSIELTDNNLHVTDRSLAGTPDQDNCLNSSKLSNEDSNND